MIIIVFMIIMVIWLMYADQCSFFVILLILELLSGVVAGNNAALNSFDASTPPLSLRRCEQFSQNHLCSFTCADADQSKSSPPELWSCLCSLCLFKNGHLMDSKITLKVPFLNSVIPFKLISFPHSHKMFYRHRVRGINSVLKNLAGWAALV